jgi:acyl carrier protein
VELVVAMEEHIGLELTNSDAEKIHSVVDAIQIFYDYLNKSKEVKEKKD